MSAYGRFVQLIAGGGVSQIVPSVSTSVGFVLADTGRCWLTAVM